MKFNDTIGSSLSLYIYIKIWAFTFPSMFFSVLVEIFWRSFFKTISRRSSMKTCEETKSFLHWRFGVLKLELDILLLKCKWASSFSCKMLGQCNGALLALLLTCYKSQWAWARVLEASVELWRNVDLDLMKTVWSRGAGHCLVMHLLACLAWSWCGHVCSLPAVG